MRCLDGLRSSTIRSSGETYISPRPQLDRFLEVGRARPFAAVLRLGNEPDRSVRARAVDPDDFAAAVFDADDAELRIGGFGFEFGCNTACDPFPPCRFGDAVDGIDPAGQMRAYQSVQRGRGSKAGDVATGARARRIRSRWRPAVNGSRCDRGRAAAAPVPGCDSSAIRPRRPRSQPARPSRWLVGWQASSGRSRCFLTVLVRIRTGPTTRSAIRGPTQYCRLEGKMTTSALRLQGNRRPPPARRPAERAFAGC